MSFNSDHLNQKLDRLDLSDKRHVASIPNKPSLLSSSLANERYSSKPPINNDDTIPEKYHDHPEPELLASSVGKEFDGKLIPSSSTISLLSLNQQSQLQHLNLNQPHNHHNQSLQQNPQVNLMSRSPQQISPQPIQGQFDDNYSFQSPKSTAYQLKPGTIKSRNSFPHLNHQKRYETYQRLTSPPLPDHSTSQSIPINQRGMVPDSPNLGPTSLNGSPSRFWLSSQTPPRSLSNSLKKVSPLTQLAPHMPTIPQQSSFSGSTPASMPMAIPNSELGKGGDSPTLNPVQTPQEEAPMTPLYLSNDNTGYFQNVNNIDEGDESDSDEMTDT